MTRPHPRHRSRNARALALAAALAMPSVVSAADTSAPAILQYFESSWLTMQKRMPDVFMSGYGAIWTPPPGRALYDDQGGGIGYNLYDRFDLGKAGDSTLYGTEKQYRALINSAHQTGGDVYVDYVHHHVGAWDVPAYTGANGFTPNYSIQDRSDYPGFELSDPYVGSSTNDPNYRNYAGQRDSYPDPTPVTDGNSPQFQYQWRLAHLITIDLTSNRSFVRNPVPGNPNNIRQAPNAWAIGTSTIAANGKPGPSTVVRQANTPVADNNRFYPDSSLPGITVTDPLTGGGTYTIHPFNTANPSQGDPVSETNAGYMMRYAQWLVNDVGVDGLRIDAARHVPYGVSGDPYNPNNLNMPALVDRAVFRQSSRYNLDGSQRSVFSFQEVFTGDKGFNQQFVRKDINPNTPNVVGGNRDVLDFPLWFAMRGNLTSNGLANNWYNIRNASQDSQDDGLANNGSQSIGFVINHDDGKGPGGSDFIHLDNVAHAWILTRPGNAYVYFNSHEFDRSGNNTFFLKDGRGDALGGQYGNIVTKLVDVRNSYGRGNFQERWIDGGGFSNVYAYERQGSMIVGLNSALGTVTNYDQRTMGSAFPAGTHLEEQTGNALDPSVDPLGEIPDVITVAAGGNVTMRIPRNQNTSGVEHGKGYVIYGLPRPTGTVSVSNVAQTMGTQLPGSNASARIASVDVITGNNFNVTLSTNKRILSDSYYDQNANGDRAYVKIDGGLNINGNAGVDYVTPGDTRYGFENFLTTNLPGYTAGNGIGSYVQSIDASQLSEGYHYLTARAFRHTSFAGEQDVYSDFRKVIYVDRVPPPSAVSGITQTGSGAGRTINARIQSLDQTGDSVHILVDTGAALNEAQILALVNNGNKATRSDQDLFDGSATVTNGTHAMTVVMYEPTGNYSILRATGVGTSGGNGLGFGDTNASGSITSSDVSTFRTVLESNNAQFNAGAEANTDGLINPADAYLLGPRLTALTADGPTVAAYDNMINTSAAVLNGTYTVDANHTVYNITSATTHVTPGNTLIARSIRGTGNTLTVDTAASLKLQPKSAGGQSSIVSTLNLTGTSQLDVADNNFVIRNDAAGTWNGSHYTGVAGLVQAGHNGGGQNGAGIVTSMSSAISPNTLTALAVAQASEILPISSGQTTLWSGLTVQGSDVLVMYTYAGDATMNGKIDADDYFALDSNYNKPASTLSFTHGDFDYNGRLNGDDYFLIDANFAAQGPSLAPAAGIDLGSAVSAVPEPAYLALSALGLGLLRRRRSFRSR